jgi:hypothetical protein
MEFIWSVFKINKISAYKKRRCLCRIIRRAIANKSKVSSRNYLPIISSVMNFNEKSGKTLNENSTHDLVQHVFRRLLCNMCHRICRSVHFVARFWVQDVKTCRPILSVSTKDFKLKIFNKLLLKIRSHTVQRTTKLFFISTSSPELDSSLSQKQSWKEAFLRISYHYSKIVTL